MADSEANSSDVELTGCDKLFFESSTSMSYTSLPYTAQLDISPSPTDQITSSLQTAELCDMQTEDSLLMTTDDCSLSNTVPLQMFHGNHQAQHVLMSSVDNQLVLHDSYNIKFDNNSIAINDDDNFASPGIIESFQSSNISVLWEDLFADDNLNYVDENIMHEDLVTPFSCDESIADDNVLENSLPMTAAENQILSNFQNAISTLIINDSQNRIQACEDVLLAKFASSSHSIENKSLLLDGDHNFENIFQNDQLEGSANNNYVPNSEQEKVSCKLCDLSFNTKKEYIIHCLGHLHKENVFIQKSANQFLNAIGESSVDDYDMLETVCDEMLKIPTESSASETRDFQTDELFSLLPNFYSSCEHEKDSSSVASPRSIQNNCVPAFKEKDAMNKCAIYFSFKNMLGYNEEPIEFHKHKVGDSIDKTGLINDSKCTHKLIMKKNSACIIDNSPLLSSCNVDMPISCMQLDYETKEVSASDFDVFFSDEEEIEANRKKYSLAFLETLEEFEEYLKADYEFDETYGNIFSNYSDKYCIPANKAVSKSSKNDDRASTQSHYHSEKANESCDSYDDATCLQSNKNIAQNKRIKSQKMTHEACKQSDYKSHKKFQNAVNGFSVAKCDEKKNTSTKLASTNEFNAPSDRELFKKPTVNAVPKTPRTTKMRQQSHHVDEQSKCIIPSFKIRPQEPSKQVSQQNINKASSSTEMNKTLSDAEMRSKPDHFSRIISRSYKQYAAASVDKVPPVPYCLPMAQRHPVSQNPSTVPYSTLQCSPVQQLNDKERLCVPLKAEIKNVKCSGTAAAYEFTKRKYLKESANDALHKNISTKEKLQQQSKKEMKEKVTFDRINFHNKNEMKKSGGNVTQLVSSKTQHIISQLLPSWQRSPNSDTQFKQYFDLGTQLRQTYDTSLNDAKFQPSDTRRKMKHEVIETKKLSHNPNYTGKKSANNDNNNISAKLLSGKNNLDSKADNNKAQHNTKKESNQTQRDMRKESNRDTKKELNREKRKELYHDTRKELIRDTRKELTLDTRKESSHALSAENFKEKNVAVKRKYEFENFVKKNMNMKKKCEFENHYRNEYKSRKMRDHVVVNTKMMKLGMSGSRKFNYEDAQHDSSLNSKVEHNRACMIENLKNKLRQNIMQNHTNSTRFNLKSNAAVDSGAVEQNMVAKLLDLEQFGGPKTIKAQKKEPLPSPFIIKKPNHVKAEEKAAKNSASRADCASNYNFFKKMENSLNPMVGTDSFPTDNKTSSNNKPAFPGRSNIGDNRNVSRHDKRKKVSEVKNAINASMSNNAGSSQAYAPRAFTARLPKACGQNDYMSDICGKNVLTSLEMPSTSDIRNTVYDHNKNKNIQIDSLVNLLPSASTFNTNNTIKADYPLKNLLVSPTKQNHQSDVSNAILHDTKKNKIDNAHFLTGETLFPLQGIQCTIRKQ